MENELGGDWAGLAILLELLDGRISERAAVERFEGLLLARGLL